MQQYTYTAQKTTIFETFRKANNGQDRKKIMQKYSNENERMWCALNNLHIYG